MPPNKAPIPAPTGPNNAIPKGFEYKAFIPNTCPSAGKPIFLPTVSKAFCFTIFCNTVDGFGNCVGPVGSVVKFCSSGKRSGSPIC